MDQFTIVQYQDTGGGDKTPSPTRSPKTKPGDISPPRLSLAMPQGDVDDSSPEERFLSPRSKLI